MPGISPVADLTMKAAEAITQYEMVVTTANDQEVDMADVQGEDILGVAQIAGVAVGDPVTVRVFGATRVIAGGAITAGNPITSGADGRAEAALIGDNVVGVALENAAANGVEFEMLLRPGPRLQL